MNGYKISWVRVIDFKGIEIGYYEWKDDEGLVVVGDHGEGKTNFIEAVRVLFGGPGELKKIDNPVHSGAKKYIIEAGVKGFSEEMKPFNIGKLFKVTQTQTVTGKPQLKIENLDGSGEVTNATPREIIKKFRGLYVDPHQLMTELEGYNGDRNLADRVLKNIGLDLSEFDTEEDRLAAQWSADDGEVVRNRKVLESIEIPVEGFPSKKVDVQQLWNESTAYKEFKERNQGSDTQKLVLESELKREIESITNAEENKIVLIENKEGISNLIKDFENQYKVTKTETIRIIKEILDDNDCEFIAKMVNVSGKASIVKEAVEETERSINRQKELYSEFGFKILDCNDNIKAFENKIVEIKIKIEQLQQPEEWKGLQDPTGELTPDQFITKSIQDATDSNAMFAKKEEYQKAETNLKASEISRDNTNKLRKINVENRTRAVAGADFQVNGLSVNENGVLTAKIDGRPVVTLKDLNHADKLRVLSELLMVNNAAPLKLIVIKEGYACKPEYQKIIFDMARKHGHTAIMESFVSLEDEGCLYMKDGTSSDTPPVDLEKFESSENIQEQVDGAPNW